MQKKKIPMRMCTGCGELRPKKELVRVVKAPDKMDENQEILEHGEVSLDLTGKKSGRGAYVCRSGECLRSARKTRKLERTLGCTIPAEVYDRMEAEIVGE